MRGLTLTQPWATLVSTGAKCIETRSWSTSYRGTLLIHAAKGFPDEARQLCQDEPFQSLLWGASIYDDDELPRGVIVAACELVQVMDTRYLYDGYIPSDLERELGNFGGWGGEVRYAWYLRDIRPLAEWIPCRGSLGVWAPPAEVVEQVRAQLGEAVPV